MVPSTASLLVFPETFAQMRGLDDIGCMWGVEVFTDASGQF
jgi:hypothetical protein